MVSGRAVEIQVPEGTKGFQCLLFEEGPTTLWVTLQDAGTCIQSTYEGLVRVVQTIY